MSEFDKEAERERLREKYERDQKKRETTERMSELLLQGATMTNAHCSDCGDPIFRYDGQEFCATCQRPVERQSADDEKSEGESAGGIEVTKPRDDAYVQFGGGEEPKAGGGDESPAVRDDEAPAAGENSASEDVPVEPTTPAETEDPSEPPAEDEKRGARKTADPSADSSAATGERTAESFQTVPSVDPANAGDIQAARTAIVETLVHFSQQAAATSDPSEAREYLATAREAAETLAALRR